MKEDTTIEVVIFSNVFGKTILKCFVKKSIANFRFFWKIRKSENLKISTFRFDVFFFSSKSLFFDFRFSLVCRYLSKNFRFFDFFRKCFENIFGSMTSNRRNSRYYRAFSNIFGAGDSPSPTLSSELVFDVF